ncbi:MAG: bifunctional 4-hydroxy-2-oxoglutarate aldolase/2-dehydro-3-deoxy-phosphogluconate aldolase [Clostridia bacterium]|nr:bifunctional 4-hydroxy-2-oxoglutarate aldolase/2-dehydro-3-deoxy-phosphogluconate aldolase [Clostridia bacterium]
MFDEMMNKLQATGIIPVVVLNDVEDALPLGERLMRGGLPAAEVTFRTEAAEESIRRLAKAYPDMLVGAGTVLTCEQADRAIDAGARFIVSPGFNPKVSEYVMEKGVPMTPGVCTPTEIEAAMSLGLDVLKFFPAEPSGGLKMLKAMCAAYVRLRFMPTGGINADNVRDYLKYDKILACGGSWMVSGSLIKEKQFDRIEELVREAAGIVREIRG